MAIIKNAKNINIQVANHYTSLSKISHEESEEVIIEATKQNLELSSQKRAIMQGFGREGAISNDDNADEGSKDEGPIITITNQKVGWGYIKLIGADDRKLKGNYITIGIPLYKMLVTHSTDKTFKLETMVSRDSWIVNRIEGKYAEIYNCAFEPKDNNEYEGVFIDVYPHHNDTAAYKLEQNNSETLHSEERFNDRKEKVFSAKSIMIHVGGFYHNEKDPTYDNKPRIRAGGSLGCFGITNKDNSSKSPSDNETKNIINKIREKSDDDKIFGYSKVKIIIEKRKDVERIKKVILPY
ncbi:hypothetical protein OK18_10660 [Chryseobacterium gallinarum]|uniref:Uncharacterized protein n=2 Tax=Chryseobacterium TaxID=59732 RepID=A0A0G3M4U2_CHRGL|nr:hypothetical protein [Chryseobacterium gallinarum]AKK73013.1 hypothetical protein OK18_10660 [Chryseobacterium gallinarum]